jgi:hypothetical protein
MDISVRALLNRILKAVCCTELTKGLVFYYVNIRKADFKGIVSRYWGGLLMVLLD